MAQRYDGRIEALRRRITEQIGRDPLLQVSRPGGGDRPRYEFTDGYIALGGAEALMYLAGMAAGLRAADQWDETRWPTTEEATA